MNVKLYMIIFLSLTFQGFAQPRDNASTYDVDYLKKIQYFSLSLSDSLQHLDSNLGEFCKKLAQMKHKFTHQKAYLHKIFRKVQQTYLKQYVQYSTLHQLMYEGKYDCVSGTALYALILRTLGFQITINETPFHTYLLVYIDDQQKVLIESTSSGTGFISSEREIVQAIHYFVRLHQAEVPHTYARRNQPISLKELAGLEKYNQAVYYFNQQEYTQSDYYLELAMELYPSQRIQAFQQFSQLYTKE